jgi:hypothetical protein
MQARLPEGGVSLREAQCYPYINQTQQCRPINAQNASKPGLVWIQEQVPTSKPRDGSLLLNTYPLGLLPILVALNGMTDIIGLCLSLLSTD